MNSQSVLQRAKDLAQQQGCLANSPGEHNQSGQLVLCAGSCIARAIVEGANDQDLITDFEERLINADKFSFIQHVFQKHGFDPDAATRVIKENDNRSEPARSNWFRSLERF